MEWLEIENMWTWGPLLGDWQSLYGLGSGLIGVAGQPDHPDPTLVCAIKVEGKCNQWRLPAPPVPETSSTYLTVWPML